MHMTNRILRRVRGLFNAAAGIWGLWIGILGAAPLTSGFSPSIIRNSPFQKVGCQGLSRIQDSRINKYSYSRPTFIPSQRRQLSVAVRTHAEEDGHADPMGYGVGPVVKLRALYISWFLINLSDRMWEFAVPFFLLTMDSIDSMRVALIYALVAGTSNVAFGPIVGYIVEKYARPRTVSIALVLQGLLVFVSWVITQTALSLGRAQNARMLWLMNALIASCTASSLANLAGTMAIERDWIKCVADEGGRLPAAKALFRSITIVCRLLAPICMGVCLCIFTPAAAAAGISAFNFLTVGLLLAVLRVIYIITPQLSQPKQRRVRMVDLLTPTQTLVRVKDGSRWVKAYRASWREYLDINGDGRLDRSEVTFGVRAGLVRCWDLWAGCFAGSFLFFWIRRIVMMPYI